MWATAGGRFAIPARGGYPGQDVGAPRSQAGQHRFLSGGNRHTHVDESWNSDDKLRQVV